MNLLEDPTTFTNYNRDDAQLELAWMFCQVVVGKNARVQAKALERFLCLEPLGSPYQRVAAMIASGALLDNLKTARLGQYTRLAQGFENSLLLNLRTASIANLKTIQGVGDKTARYFILHTRENQKIAVLDRHILRFMRGKGYDVPKAVTPNGKKYLELEQSFLAEALLVDMTPADFDLMLWNKYSKVVKP